ncbi:VOC family protein [Brevundimonas sp. Root1279]|uniref:VOC family protein n=1 Tax=Brevundimonas sp. Root1279 TaxID=1736443 RepID=UPI0006FD797C|nr:VOC family protein [Brevundimonas sp. Root1279]KQW82586.1 glyoxalase [Brevundimonas sp. Root1279]
MIDHIGLAVSDIARSRAFYEKALAPLGMHVLATIPPDRTETGGTAVMFGGAEGVTFVIADNERPGEGNHVAFRAGTRDQVEAFHAAALAAGGTDHGAPGLREHYGPTYYAAFVLDPDGFNIEAVCHAAE